MSGVPIFIGYSRQDLAWWLKLMRHLRIFELSDDLSIWSDSRIKPGSNWSKEILKAIDDAHLAILLVSADFLSSNFIMKVEVPRILNRYRDAELRVVPLLVEDCPWQDVNWLAELQMRPWDAVPLAAKRRAIRETELAKVAREILAIARSCPSPTTTLV